MEKSPHDDEEEEVGWSRTAREAAEAASRSTAQAGLKRKHHESRRGGLRRLSRPVPLSVLSMLCAVFGAILLWLNVDFTFDKRIKVYAGANIIHAVPVAFFGLLIGLLLIGFVRRHRVYLSALLCFEVAILAAGIVLVALDGGSYKAEFRCEFLCFGGPDLYTSAAHVSYPYVLWGVPIAVLLVQALRVLREGPPGPGSPGSRYEHPDWSQQDPAAPSGGGL
jgi:hypothetical protein